MSFVLGSPPQAKKIIVLSTKNIHLPILEWEYTNFVRSLFWEGRDNVGRDGDRISNVGRDVPPVTPLKGGTGKLCSPPPRAQSFEDARKNNDPLKTSGLLSYPIFDW